MGINCSSIASVSDSEYAAKLSGKEAVSEHDPFWNQLFSFTFKPPMERDDSIKLEQITEPWCKLLFENNQRTGSFGTLVRQFLSRSRELAQSVDCENKVFVWQAQNALFIVRHLCKFAVENMSEEKLVEQFEARSLDERKADLAAGVLTSEVEDVCFSRFIESLIDVIVSVPVIDFTYQIHVEALNTFLVLLSPQIFLPDPAHDNIVSRTIRNRIQPQKIDSLMRALLQNFIDRRPIPRTTSEDKATESIVIGLASAVVSGLKNVMTFKSAPAKDAVEEKDLHPTIARQSCLLMLALCMQKSYTMQDNKLQGVWNPFQQSISRFRHVQGPQFVRSVGDGGPPVPSASFHINLSRLYTTACSELSSELTTLLLYNLLHQNTDVRAFILSKTEVESLVLPLLKVLYAAPQQNSHHIYMSLIVLLMLTEDNHFNKSVHDVPIHETSWYTDRALTDVTLGDLIILVLIRTVQFNISQMRDQYLHTNCLAALANMSAHFKRLHHYAAQRIFGMLSMLASKMHRIKNKEMRMLAEEVAGNSAPQPPSDEVHLDMTPTTAVTSMDMGVMTEITRMLMEIVNSCLTGNALRNNANLVYALLQSRSTFDKLHDFDQFRDVLQNVDTLLVFFDSRLEQMNQPTMTVEEVHDFIREVVVQIPSHRLQKYPELKFRYVEEERPEEFFVPYVWSLIYSKSGVFWNPGCIQLFSLD